MILSKSKKVKDKTKGEVIYYLSREILIKPEQGIISIPFFLIRLKIDSLIKIEMKQEIPPIVSMGILFS